VQNIGSILKAGVRKYGHKEAVVFEEVRLTYTALDERVNRLAHGLASLGCTQGKTLAILSQNSHKYLEVYLAAAKLGLIVVPLNFMFLDDELIHAIDDSEAAICMVGEDYVKVAERIKPHLNPVARWIALDDESPSFGNYEDLLRNHPKGIMLSHRNILNSAKALMGLLDLRSIDVGCFVLPLYQTEIVNAFCMLMAGGKVVINRKVDTSEILRLIQDERCTHINLVPDLYDWLRQDPHFEDYNLSSLKLLTYSGSAFRPGQLSQCVKTFWKRFAQSYGSMETAGSSITALSSEDHILEGPGSNLLASAGKPLNAAKVKIVDRHAKFVKAGEIGEVVVKSPSVMVGYWKQPEITRQVLKDSWLRTGDMGYLDSKGYLYLVGRKSQRMGEMHTGTVVAFQG
jgi:acyl-CoA synthetase (AMP-forming)/AMP-acid ligase II